eukprot:gb/GECG01009139.1/.p1 GENE.gb/GECG01009139.1/~~gb/GECG01009139.1/.p1  ORF type:complete len:576 (+),score=67.05 gb/GECG01009139.1/:1-1728(+)
MDPRGEDERGSQEEFMDPHTRKKQKETSELDQLADAFSRKASTRTGGPRGPPPADYGTPQSRGRGGRGTGSGVVSSGLGRGGGRGGVVTGQRSKGGGGPPKYHASQSHHLNDAYMRDWDKAYQQLYGEDSEVAAAQEESYKRIHGATGQSSSYARQQIRGPGGGTQGAGAASQKSSSSGGVPAGNKSIPILQEAQGRTTASGLDPKLELASLPDQFCHGPQNPEGDLVDLSDRPLLCMSVDINRGEAVIGGSDHALYTVDLNARRKARTLYTKRYGHTEWVTCVTHLSDGRIVSGAMDARLCVWDTRGVRCSSLEGHFGSVSCVDSVNQVVVSAGYDKTVRLWDANSSSQLALCKGHSAPVLALEARGTMAVSGDRDGVGMVWDLQTGSSKGKLLGHKGHLTAVGWLRSGPGLPSDADLILTGAQDGHVRAWDCRMKNCVANIGAHAHSSGTGAVGEIRSTTVSGGTDPTDPGTGSDFVVTAGADKGVCVLDPRKGFEVAHTFTEHRDFVYSLHTVGSLAFSGAGDGTMITHDLSTFKPLWAIGANKAAVRCIGATESTLVASGDDGNVLMWDMR